MNRRFRDDEDDVDDDDEPFDSSLWGEESDEFQDAEVDVDRVMMPTGAAQARGTAKMTPTPTPAWKKRALLTATPRAVPAAPTESPNPTTGASTQPLLVLLVLVLLAAAVALLWCRSRRTATTARSTTAVERLIRRLEPPRDDSEPAPPPRVRLEMPRRLAAAAVPPSAADEVASAAASAAALLSPDPLRGPFALPTTRFDAAELDRAWSRLNEAHVEEATTPVSAPEGRGVLDEVLGDAAELGPDVQLQVHRRLNDNMDRLVQQAWSGERSIASARSELQRLIGTNRRRPSVSRDSGLDQVALGSAIDAALTIDCMAAFEAQQLALTRAVDEVIFESPSSSEDDVALTDMAFMVRSAVRFDLSRIEGLQRAAHRLAEYSRAFPPRRAEERRMLLIRRDVLSLAREVLSNRELVRNADPQDMSSIIAYYALSREASLYVSWIVIARKFVYFLTVTHSWAGWVFEWYGSRLARQNELREHDAVQLVEQMHRSHLAEQQASRSQRRGLLSDDQGKYEREVSNRFPSILINSVGAVLILYVRTGIGIAWRRDLR